MKAYRLFPNETQLRLVEIELSQPSVGEVLIKVQACGLCHSDCHILHGAGWVKRPITLGHEVAGEIVDLGKGVLGFQIGDRVAVALIAPSSAIGLDFDGGFAEYALVPAQNLVGIPSKVSFEQAAVATDAALTAYNAVIIEANVKASTTVAILGLGGLGLFGLKFATLQGATVYGIDIEESKFAAAYDSGARACGSSLESFKDVVFDTIIDFVGLTATVAAAVASVKRKGRVVLVGLGATEVTLPTFPIVYKQIEIKGSLGGNKDGLVVVLDLISEGKIAPTLEEIPFSEISQGFSRLESGQVDGRLFTRPNGTSSH